MSQVFRLDDFRHPGKRSVAATFFTRHELNALISLYSRRVAKGEWRDYAIDHRTGMAVFSIFRHTHELPLYSVVKRSSGSGKNGEYLLFSGRHRLARAKTLGEVLKTLERQARVVS
jgi:hypothetical protein